MTRNYPSCVACAARCREYNFAAFRVWGLVFFFLSSRHRKWKKDLPHAIKVSLLSVIIYLVYNSAWLNPKRLVTGVQRWASAFPMFSVNGLLDLKINQHFFNLRVFGDFLFYLLLDREELSPFPNSSLYCHPTSPVYAITIDFCVSL